MNNKKGALELSVTAIVILILAIVILGLGLGFIRGMFGRVTTSMEEQVAAEPEPPTPTASNPITLSRESLIVHSGDNVVLKVGIYNPSNEDWIQAYFSIECTGVAAGEEIIKTGTSQFNKKDINSGQGFIGTFLFQVGKISPKTYLCQAKSKDDSGEKYKKDMIIKVIS